MCPEMEGSKTAAVDLLQVDEPCNAQTVKLSSKSLIEKWVCGNWWYVWNGLTFQKWSCTSED